ncbi:hypothetical protein KY495_22895 [Massilia sp. PAMC28688]|uniref:START domain-containing protein n=1 Tax=Massilia sp. PAMC28688 TaxID=2861283 RepID=UPI001C63A7ED|nr:START domain-containing protein [Massilia sp. PAMC28688]QYF93476.1 hypothetical protein KY495_22895 [Massilia sp. PAMC28688]
MSAAVKQVEIVRNEVDTAAPAVKAPSWRRKLWRAFLGLLALVLVTAIVAHFAFKHSGNRQWEFVTEDKGVKVYAMKVPGNSLKHFKAVFRVKSTLSRVTAFMQDNDSELDVDFYKAVELQRHGPQMMITTWRSGFPAPFKDRDFVVRHTFTQNPVNKEVTYALQSLPDLIPPESCCVRVPRMDNAWQIIPLKNGEIEIHWLIDMDIGGFMPYFMINNVHPEIMTDFGSKLQGYFDRAIYANVKYDWIVEP